jgi:hypothetical protein
MMSDLIAHLKKLAVSGSEAIEVLEAAEQLLSGGTKLETELANPDETIKLVQKDADRIRKEAQSGMRRFPASSAGGFHRSDLDPRAMATLATLAYAKKGGIYELEELTNMLEQGNIPHEWFVREAVRLRTLFIILPMLILEMETSGLHPSDFAEKVTEAARRLGRIKIPKLNKH